MIQSLFCTAKFNGLDPDAWLKDTREKLTDWPLSRIDELLPLRRGQEAEKANPTSQWSDRTLTLERAQQVTKARGNTQVEYLMAGMA